MQVLPRPSCQIAFAGLILLVGWLMPCCRGASTIAYNTGFEQAEGYNSGFTLMGQQGWVGCGTGGNGVYAFNNNQLALIGDFAPTSDSEAFTSVWKPINLVSIPSNAIVHFSTDMTVIDSTTVDRDEFRWSAYNTSTNRLFSLVFDNASLGIYYIVSDGRTFYANTTFQNGQTYKLSIAMDFARNRWNASLDGNDLHINSAISVNSYALNLGDMDAVWFYTDPTSPGDNYMLFDNYRVSLESTNPATVDIASIINNTIRVRLYGESGLRYAIEGSTNLLANSWVPIGTNTVSSGYFDVTDIMQQRRFYRGRLVP